MTIEKACHGLRSITYQNWNCISHRKIQVTWCHQMIPRSVYGTPRTAGIIRRCTSIQRISYSAYEAMAKNLSQSKRGHYNAFDLVTMIVDVINEINVATSLGLYLVYVNEDHGGRVRMGCQNGSKPRFIMICDNPFFEFISGPYTEPGGMYLFCYIEYHCDWHIRIPELTTPSKFASAVYKGLVWLEQSWKSLIVGTRTRIAK